MTQDMHENSSAIEGLVCYLDNDILTVFLDKLNGCEDYNVAVLSKDITTIYQDVDEASLRKQLYKEEICELLNLNAVHFDESLIHAYIDKLFETLERAFSRWGVNLERFIAMDIWKPDTVVIFHWRK